MLFMVCHWPQSQEGDWVRPHLYKLARCGRWPAWKRFIKDHVWRGRLKPGCWIVGSGNNCWWFNHAGILCIHEILFNAIGKLTEQRSTSPIHTDIHPFFSDWTWVIQLPSWIILNLFTATASCTFSIGELFSHSSISDHYHIFYVTLWCVTDFSYCSALQYSAPDRGAEYCYASVCLSVCVCVRVCLSTIISSELHVRFSPNFCAWYLWPWLSPHLAA